MNLRERKMLHRIYRALHDVPGAHIGGGTKSATVGGVVSFGYDIQKVRGWCGDALMALFDGSLSKEESEENFEAAISLAEEYIAKRTSAGWSIHL